MVCGSSGGARGQRTLRSFDVPVQACDRLLDVAAAAGV
jgi:hypothetical protein